LPQNKRSCSKEKSCLKFEKLPEIVEVAPKLLSILWTALIIFLCQIEERPKMQRNDAHLASLQVKKALPNFPSITLYLNLEKQMIVKDHCLFSK
jgi:hypothetical protein